MIARKLAERAALPAVGLVLVTVLAYLPALRAGYVWDDDDYLTENPTLADAHGLRRIWLEPGAVPQYYPLYHTTYWIERRLWDLRPFGYHAVNVLLHAAGACLLWLVLRRLKIAGAWFAAAVFALHPVQVESVAWVTERKNVLSGAFFFGALLSWSGFAFNGSGARRAYVLSLWLFACALLSKTATAMLAPCQIVLTWWRQARFRRTDTIALIPFFLFGGALGLLTIAMERGTVGARGAEFELSMPERLLVAGRAVWFYLGKLLWPQPLSFVYPRWRIDASDAVAWLHPLAVVALTAALWFGRKRLGRAPLAAWLWFLVCLAPASGFFDVYWMRYSFVADHFQYLAAAGPIVFLTAGAARLLRTRQERAGRALSPARIASVAAPALLLLLLGGLTFRQARAYRNEETLWLDALAKNPSWLAAHNLGALYNRQDRLDEAIRYYEQAAALRPDLEEGLYNLAGAAARAGRLEDAARWYGEALRVRPDRAESHNNLGNVLFQLGRKDEAIRHFESALRALPDYASAHRNLAHALFDAGRLREAAASLRRALEIEPEDSGSMNRLSLVLLYAPDATPQEGLEAVSWAERAVRASRPANPLYLGTLAAAYAESGRTDEAARAWEQAMEIAGAAGQAEVVERLKEQRAAYAARGLAAPGRARRP